MKCEEVVRTSQSGPFFIKSTLLPQCLLWLQYICCREGPGEQPGMAMSFSILSILDEFISNFE